MRAQSPLFKTYQVLYKDLRKQEQNLDNILLIYDFYDRHHHTDFNPVLMKDGSMITLFKISGMDYEGLSEQEKAQLSYYMRMACEKLGKGFTLTNYLIRRPAKFVPMKEYPAAPEIIRFINERKNEYWNDIAKWSLENDLLMCLRFYKGKREKKFSEMISERKIIALEREQILDSISRLHEGFQSLKSSFLNASIGLERFDFIELSREQIFGELYRIINSSEAPVYRPDLSLNAQLCHTRIEFGKDFARFNGDLYVKAISVKYPPPSTIAFHLRRLFDLPFRYVLCQSFGFIDYEQFEKKMVQNRNIALSLSRVDKNSQIYVNEVSELENHIKTEKQIPLYWKFYIFVFGKSKEEVEKNAFTVSTILKDIGSFGLAEVGNLRNAVFSMFPGHSRLSARKAVLLTANAGDLLCAYTLYKGDPEPIEFFLDRLNGVFSYHPFTRRENAHHSIYCGPTGGGKSFLINRMIISSLVEKPNIYVIDISKSFNPLFELLAEYMPEETAVMEISVDKIDFQFNPFLLEPDQLANCCEVTEDQILFCEGLITIMLGRKCVNETNRIHIRETVVQFFREYKSLLKNMSAGEIPPPPLNLLVDILKDKSKDKDLYNALRLWTFGRKAKLFNSGKDNLGKAKFSLFDLESLCSTPDSADELVAVIYTIFHKIFKDISAPDRKSERKYLFLDEAHRYLLQPEFSYWMNHLFRTGRHFNLLVGLITQSINDIFSSQDWSKGIVTNLKQAIMFSGQRDVDAAFESLGMSVFHKEQFQRLNKERREFYYWSFSGLRRILSPSTDPYTYFLATTDPEERKLRKIYREVFGDMKAAIEKMVSITEGATALKERISRLTAGLVNEYPETARKFNLEGR